MNKRILIILLIISLGIFIYYRLKPYSNPNEVEHIISIISNNKKIEAVTGSFCYKNGLCIDKIDFQEFNYDVMPSYYDNKLFIKNLDGSINSIELFNYSIREFDDTKITYTNEYIVTPNVSGVYIFLINAIYEGKNIEYYFMTNISKTSGEEINVKMELKDSSITDKGLTMIVKNLSNLDLQYGNPYTIEKYEEEYWQTVKPINDIAFTLPSFNLNKNDLVELNVDWEYGYGRLKGKYRIVKSFDYSDNDRFVSFNKYLEFEVK